MSPALAIEDDPILVARAQRGDERAFVDLYRKHVRHLANLLHGILREDAAVDEAIQDVFADAHTWLCSRPRVEAGGFRARISRAAVRRARQRLAARHRLRLLTRLLAHLNPWWRADGEPRSPDDPLARLRPSLRIAWVLVEIGGHTPEEAARLCDVSLGRFERQLVRARAGVGRGLDAG